MNAMRERTLVGLFVVIAGALLFFSVLAISGGLGTPGVPHRAYFKYTGGSKRARGCVSEACWWAR